ncbi:hypothetical protein JNUCC32_29050 [Paenibacillus sp. JNUCC32]|nr:hypothetical protein [Paenibacillus sp. JNUCC-32]QOT10103.1 hypothetical protein JNUCC32_29050 [Paenibacillus sp. JNUCC-32]
MKPVGPDPLSYRSLHRESIDDPVQLAKKNAAAARAVGIWPKTMTIRRN